ncbi:pickpocket protein 28-like [Musca vetustissima]|uniref:pickpocket protein 28-like n=1 Tax=Musca vetustissima TaxID=27455 RepID=UPI002AB660F2|nr:pickpocket protein 28-like [Musca vetustissima]
MFFLRTCNCIPYFLPKIFDNATICYIQHFDCQKKAERVYTDPETMKCKKECLSSCHDLSYMPDVFETPLATDDFELDNSFMRNFSKEYISENLALVNIYFPQNYYRSSIKTPYTGLTEYLSQTGGIMSLMIGFSVFSLVEFAYFFIIKPLMQLWTKIFRKNIINVGQVEARREYAH